jgi:hypothetical protein
MFNYHSWQNQSLLLRLCLISSFVQLIPPAMAETTMLTGRVSSNIIQLPVTQIPVTQVSATRDAVLESRTSAYTDLAPTGAIVPIQTSAPILHVNPQPPRTVYIMSKPEVTKVYIRDERTFWQRHPKVKAATIGAGVGAAGGAVVGLISGRGIVRGAAIGAGSGAGVGLVRSSNTLKRHPIVRDTATGSLVGLGIGGAASRHKGWLKGAGVGAAVGLGYGLLKNGLQ